MSSSNTTRRSAAMSVRSSDKSSAAMSVYDGPRCIGFIIAHGRTSYESLDVDQQFVGLFSHEGEAAAALWRIGRGQVLINQEKGP
jgi:hypothetical protein